MRVFSKGLFVLDGGTSAAPAFPYWAWPKATKLAPESQSDDKKSVFPFRNGKPKYKTGEFSKVIIQ